MNQCFVYYIKSQNRLIILKDRINNSDYYLLMDNNGGSESELYNLCKTFCIGYILGSQNGLAPINNVIEFQ
jgi:hypothetical protein